jgi:hypothetical protein
MPKTQGTYIDDVVGVFVKHDIPSDEWPQTLAVCLAASNARVMSEASEMQREGERGRLLGIIEGLRLLVEHWTPTTAAEEAFVLSKPGDLPQA